MVLFIFFAINYGLFTLPNSDSDLDCKPNGYPAVCRTFHSARSEIQILYPTAQYRNGIRIRTGIGIGICECKEARKEIIQHVADIPRSGPLRWCGSSGSPVRSPPPPRWTWDPRWRATVSPPRGFPREHARCRSYRIWKRVHSPLFRNQTTSTLMRVNISS